MNSKCINIKIALALDQLLSKCSCAVGYFLGKNHFNPHKVHGAIFLATHIQHCPDGCNSFCKALCNHKQIDIFDLHRLLADKLLTNERHPNEMVLSFDGIHYQISSL